MGGLVGSPSDIASQSRAFSHRRSIDAADLLLVWALAGNDLVDVALDVTIGGTIDGGDGTDTCSSPSSWTKINCEA